MPFNSDKVEQLADRSVPDGDYHCVVEKASYEIAERGHDAGAEVFQIQFSVVSPPKYKGAKLFGRLIVEPPRGMQTDEKWQQRQKFSATDFKSLCEATGQTVAECGNKPSLLYGRPIKLKVFTKNNFTNVGRFSIPHAADMPELEKLAGKSSLVEAAKAAGFQQTTDDIPF